MGLRWSRTPGQPNMTMGIMTSDDASRIYDTFWSLKFALFPHRCVKSKKLIWFTKAYNGITVFRYDTDMLTHTIWMSKKEFLFYKLRGLE